MPLQLRRKHRSRQITFYQQLSNDIQAAATAAGSLALKPMWQPELPTLMTIGCVECLAMHYRR